MKLTNRTETFQITEQSDELGPATGFDSKGSTYARCDIGVCDHEHAPTGARVWHDDSHTEELWEVREPEERFCAYEDDNGGHWVCPESELPSGVTPEATGTQQEMADYMAGNYPEEIEEFMSGSEATGRSF